MSPQHSCSLLREWKRGKEARGPGRFPSFKPDLRDLVYYFKYILIILCKLHTLHFDHIHPFLGLPPLFSDAPQSLSKEEGRFGFMGAHHRMGLSMWSSYTLSFRELSSSTGDLDFISFMLRPSLGFGQASRGALGFISKSREWQPTSETPPELGTQWQCNHDLRNRPKQSNREGRVTMSQRNRQCSGVLS